jgi:hypothetical protein
VNSKRKSGKRIKGRSEKIITAKSQMYMASPKSRKPHRISKPNLHIPRIREKHIQLKVQHFCQLKMNPSSHHTN